MMMMVMLPTHSLMPLMPYFRALPADAAGRHQLRANSESCALCVEVAGIVHHIHLAIVRTIARAISGPW
jgi:hypothetical protein